MFICWHCPCMMQYPVKLLRLWLSYTISFSDPTLAWHIVGAQYAWLKHQWDVCFCLSWNHNYVLPSKIILTIIWSRDYEVWFWPRNLSDLSLEWQGMCGKSHPPQVSCAVFFQTPYPHLVVCMESSVPGHRPGCLPVTPRSQVLRGTKTGFPVEEVLVNRGSPYRAVRWCLLGFLVGIGCAILKASKQKNRWG